MSKTYFEIKSVTALRLMLRIFSREKHLPNFYELTSETTFLKTSSNRLKLNIEHITSRRPELFFFLNFFSSFHNEFILAYILRRNNR